MARYTWGYDNEVFTSLRQAKEAVAELIAMALEKNGAEMIYDGRGRALYEVDVTVKLRPH